MMTNREVIQLFAKYEPELIEECFSDAYVMGENSLPYIFGIKNWLNKECDKYFFREQDVERLLNISKFSDKYIFPKRKHPRKQRGRTAPNREDVD